MQHYQTVLFKMVRVSKVETTELFQSQCAEDRPAVTGNKPRRILASPAKSLRWLSQETGISSSPCRILSAVLLISRNSHLPGKHNRVAYRQWFQIFDIPNRDILDLKSSDEACFISRYTSTHRMRECVALSHISA
jgi:hypothetical protein